MAFSDPTDAYTAANLAARIPKFLGNYKLVLIDLEPFVKGNRGEANV